MFFFPILISILFFTPSQQHTLDSYSPRRILRSAKSDFKRIPKFVALANDEKREVYYYEQTIVVKDSGSDNKVRRCEVIEVYEERRGTEVLQNLTSSFNSEPRYVNMKMIMSIMEDCDSVDDKFKKETSGDRNYLMFPDEEMPEQHGQNPLFNGIFPGRKWCGLGDIADSYHDLSGIRNVDRCCRAHDLCQIKVRSHDNRYDIKNSALYTKSHCTCDEHFHDCLKRDNGWAANIIGNLYFYVGAPDCIKGFPDLLDESMQFVKATKKCDMNT